MLLVAVCSLAASQLSAQQPNPFPTPGATPRHVVPAEPPALSSDNAADFVRAPLADITVEGNTTIPEAAILSRLSSIPGRPVTDAQVRDDVAKLLSSNWFASVSPTFRATDDGPVLVFRVVEKPILHKVEFVGNEHIKEKTLRDMTGLTEGHGFDVFANKRAAVRIEQYYKEKGYYFAEVELEKGGDPSDRDVVFRITEGSKVKVHRIRFDGNDAISGPVLKTKLATKTAILWLIGGNYDPESIRNDAIALTRYYHSLGYFDAQVEPVEEFSDDNSSVRVTFRIEEGVQSRIRSIVLAGNGVIGSEQLLTNLNLPEGAAFNERLLSKDVTAMQAQYDELGRLFAQVEPQPRFLEEAGWIDLVYHIDEDKPYLIGKININIEGDHPHSREQVVRNQVNQWIQPGKLARMSDIQSAQVRLRGAVTWERSVPATINVRPVDGNDYLPPTLLARGQSLTETARHEPIQPQGFGHSVFKQQTESATPPPAQPTTEEQERAPRPRPLIDHGVRYNIDPDSIFRGQTPDEFQLRGQSIDRNGQPIPYDPLQTVSPQGDPFGDAIRNPATPGFVDVDIDVTEGRTGRLMFGVGVNSDAGVVGSVVLQEDNFDILRPPTSWSDIVNGHAFRGRGQSFRLELVPGNQVSRYSVNWQDPYFLNTDFSLGLTGFYYNRFYNQWTEDRLGGRISIGRLINRYWSAGVSLRLENVGLTGISGLAPPEITNFSGDNFLSAVGLTVTYDTRDSAFMPTAGHFAEFAYEQAFGEFDYPRFELTGGQFFTLWERPDGYGKHILQFRGQLGWTGNDTPVFESFYAGGYQSFRGFAFRGVSPRVNGFAVGGQWMMLGTAEYMIPITADDNIRAVVFSDFGTVEPDVSVDHFRVTAGFGLRLAIPAMGPAPIALDFAWPIVQERFDNERVFSFYVGFTR